MEDEAEDGKLEKARHKSHGGTDWLPIVLGIGFLGFLAFLAFIVIAKPNGTAALQSQPLQAQPLYVAIPASLKSHD